MKIVRLAHQSEIAYGAVEGDRIRLYHGSPLVVWEPTETLLDPDQVRLLAPVFPTKVVAVGRNYADHAAEMGGQPPTHPILFMKPSTAVIGPGAAIVLPPEATTVHHEAELAVVIARPARRVAAADVGAYIFGYTAANDVTARDLQKADGQWTRAKGFDTFCPLGPSIETELDPAGLRIACRVNRDLRQAADTSDMVFGVGELIEFVTAVMTLLPGDVLLTGTPAGVGPLVDGDTVEVEIEGIGVLANPVRAKP